MEYLLRGRNFFMDVIIHKNKFVDHTAKFNILYHCHIIGLWNNKEMI